LSSFSSLSIDGISSSKLFTSSVFKVAILVADGKVLKNAAGLSTKVQGIESNSEIYIESYTFLFVSVETY